jgi:hypothetical protein
VHRSNDTVLMT